MSSIKRWLFVAIGGLAILLAAGVIAAGAFLSLHPKRQPTPTPLPRWVDPISQIEREGIEPPLALLSLAGASDLEAVNSALDGGELESAYAAIVFSTGLTDQQRAGSLLLLAQRYIATENGLKAKLCYQQVNTIATLSPALPDFSRAEAYLQVGQGLATLGEREDALFNYDQAHTIALYSPYLKEPHRAYILDQLAEAYAALGEGERAGQCSEQSAEARWPAKARSLSLPSSPEGAIGEIPPQPEVEAARERRVAAARSLIDCLKAVPGEVPSDLLEGLAQALRAEDEARRKFYEAQLPKVFRMATKVALARDKIEWLTIKYRVALGGFGLSILPEWEGQLAHIRSDLNGAYEELYAFRSEQVIALPQAEDIDRAWLALIREEIEAGRLGLYPNYPEERLISKLRGATAKLIAGGERGLRVEAFCQDGVNVFYLTAGE